MYQIRIYYRAGILLQIIQVVFNGICQVRPLLCLSMQVAVASDPAKLHINLSWQMHYLKYILCSLLSIHSSSFSSTTSAQHKLWNEWSVGKVRLNKCRYFYTLIIPILKGDQ